MLKFLYLSVGLYAFTACSQVAKEIESEDEKILEEVFDEFVEKEKELYHTLEVDPQI